MRPWFKWTADAPPEPDATYEEYASTMGGYEANEAYASRETLFDLYFRSDPHGRLQVYEDFLLRQLRPGMEILSIASGRCLNELRLLERGFDVTCSDLGVLPAAEATARLYPDWRFEIVDILAGPAPRRYDAVVCLQLIYAFDDADLRCCLEHIAASLRPGGLLILDPGGSADNALSSLINDVLLPLEARIVQRRRGQATPLVRKLHGYRRSDGEIDAAAAQAGLVLRDRRASSFLLEFRRSLLFNRFVPAGSRRERAFERLGRRIPYVRLSAFELSSP